MPKVALTAAYAATAQCPDGARKLVGWSEEIPGFILEIRPTSKTYAFRYVDDRGKQRQVKIARYGDVTFSAARKVAERLRSETVLGNNPAARKEERKAVPTYAELAEQHIAEARRFQKSWWSVAGIIQNHLLPSWGRMRLDEITAQAVGVFLADKAAEGLKPATVEKIRAVLGRSFELGRRWGVPGAEHNPVRDVPRPKFDNKVERFLSAQEAARLLEATSRSYNPLLRPIVHLLLLTGARVGELLRAEWRHVDLERRLWLIPTSKNGKGRYVPLAAAAVAVIADLPRFEGCPYLVPNPETRRPFVSIKHAWQTARREAGLSDLRIHDLRHSFASFLAGAGVDLLHISRALGHSDYKSTLRYAHATRDGLAAAVEAGAAKMGEAGHHGV